MSRQLILLILFFAAALLVSGCGPLGSIPVVIGILELTDSDEEDKPPPPPPVEIDLTDSGTANLNPTTCAQGALVSVSCDVVNNGPSSSGPFFVAFYASTDAIFNTSDYYLGGVSMNSIAGNSSGNCDLTQGITSFITPGTYYVGWIIDSAGAVSETNETNNIFYLSGTPLTVTSPPAATYTVSTTAQGMTSVSVGSTTVFDGSVSTYDDEQISIPIGFAFKFFGRYYNMVSVCTNGVVGLANTVTDYDNLALPTASAPNGIIALFWDDLQVEANGTTDHIYYRLDGIAPSRILTIEYHSVTRRNEASSYMYGQIKLHEASGDIHLCYDSLGNWTGVTASIGIENADGTVGYDPTSASPNVSAIPSVNYIFSHD